MAEVEGQDQGAKTYDQNIAPSPLAEVDPNSLDELFDRINLKLTGGMPELITDEDLEPLISALRAQRSKFILEQDKLGKAPPAPRKAKPKSIAQVIALDF